MMDEIQLAIPFDFVEVKYFKTEKEAEEFNKTIEGRSDIGHIDDYYYVTLPNPLSKVIYKAIDDVCKDLELRVPLGMAWTSGLNWENCH